MIQQGTTLLISDRSGIALAECIKVLGSRKRAVAYLGDVVLVSIKKVNLIRYALLKDRQKKKFSRGTVHRALIIRVKVPFSRFKNIFLRFSENSAVLVNKKIVPLSNRIYGPVLKELCLKYPSIGCVSRFMI